MRVLLNILCFVVTLSYCQQSETSRQKILQSLDNAPVIHFTLSRRGGTFEATKPSSDHLELDLLLEQLRLTEARFDLTQREVKGNKLVRKAKTSELMGKIASNGSWYANFAIGEPPQSIQVDLNMLTSDFYVLRTSSHAGSQYDDLFSQSFVKSIEDARSSGCTLPTDVFHLPNINKSLALIFAYCRPLKVSQSALKASGSMLGLAPSIHLRQTSAKSLLDQLLHDKIVDRPIFSLMLINGHEGVLSIGGTIANAVDMVNKHTAEELNRAGAKTEMEGFLKENGRTTEDGTNTLDATKTSEKILLHKRRSESEGANARQGYSEEGWTWSNVQGAEGWWQTLMPGVWVGGSRVSQNQAVVVDINTPFILAPPMAAKAFYASISGSRPLEPPYSNFYAFPCINPPELEFEFHGTRFPVMRGGRGLEWDSAIIPGGKFSLGRLKHGSGYCVGAVVETRMGLKEEKGNMAGGRKSGLGLAAAGAGDLAGNGMRDVWVIGEGFFRGVGAVFDLGDKKIGFRTY